MDVYEKQLEEEIPDFEEHVPEKHGAFDISATVSTVKIHGWKQVTGIIAVAIVILGGLELLIRLFEVPEFVFPAPSATFRALVTSFPNNYIHFLITLSELVSGYVVGASIGLVLAAVLTQVPYLEKIIVPYILLLICTPTLALVPLPHVKAWVQYLAQDNSCIPGFRSYGNDQRSHWIQENGPGQDRSSQVVRGDDISDI